MDVRRDMGVASETKCAYTSTMCSRQIVVVRGISLTDHVDPEQLESIESNKIQHSSLHSDLIRSPRLPSLHKTPSHCDGKRHLHDSSTSHARSNHLNKFSSLLEAACAHGGIEAVKALPSRESAFESKQG